MSLATIRGVVAILEGDAPEGIRISHALAVLRAVSGVSDDEPGERDVDAAERRREADRIRQRNWRRARSLSRNETVTGPVTSSVTADSDLKSSSLSLVFSGEKELKGSMGAAPVTRDANAVTVTRDVTARDKRGTRAPSSVDPGAAAWCAGHGIPEPTPGSEAAAFLDYWSQRTRDATSLDWSARWRSRPEWTKERTSGVRRVAPNVQPPAPPGQSAWTKGDGHHG